MRFSNGVIRVGVALAVVAGVLVPAAAAGAASNNRYVATSGVDSGACTSSSSPCATVSYAVSQAVTGNTIYVAAGSYPEIVTVDKSLTFRGANAGVRAGTVPATRSAESIVKGFRSPGTPYPTSAFAFNVTVDGFTIDPQGDAALIAGGAVPFHLVSLFGGPSVTVQDNIFNGGPFVPDCSYTCTTMTDSALMLQSGKFKIQDNSFTNFRRPVDISQNTAAFPILGGTFSGNSFSHITSRAIWLREGDCFGSTPPCNTAVDTMHGITIKNNSFDGTGSLSPVTGGPAGIVMTTSGNKISNNVFTGNDPAVFDQVCDPSNHPTAAPNKFAANTFAANTDGIMYYAVDPNACPAVVDAKIAGNAFTGNTGYGVRWYPEGTAPNSFKATCNWWGDANGPGFGPTGLNKVTSQVVVAPWLVSATGPCGKAYKDAGAASLTIDLGTGSVTLAGTRKASSGLGKSTWTASNIVIDTSNLPIVGVTYDDTITGANGTLTTSAAATIDITTLGVSPLVFKAHEVITGGTGAFATASGAINSSGLVDLDINTGVGTMTFTSTGVIH